METGVESGGGLGYSSDGELLTALRRLVYDHDLRDELAEAGFARRAGDWSESAHLDRYFQLIGGIKAGRPTIQIPPRPKFASLGSIQPAQGALGRTLDPDRPI